MNDITLDLLPLAFERATGKRSQTVTLPSLVNSLYVVWGVWRDGWIELRADKISERFTSAQLGALLDQVLDQAYEWNWDWQEGPEDDAESIADYTAYGLACVQFYRCTIRHDGIMDLKFTEAELQVWLDRHGDNQQMSFL